MAFRSGCQCSKRDFRTLLKKNMEGISANRKQPGRNLSMSSISDALCEQFGWLKPSSESSTASVLKSFEILPAANIMKPDSPSTFASEPSEHHQTADYFAALKAIPDISLQSIQPFLDQLLSVNFMNNEYLVAGCCITTVGLCLYQTKRLRTANRALDNIKAVNSETISQGIIAAMRDPGIQGAYGETEARIALSQTAAFCRFREQVSFADVRADFVVDIPIQTESKSASSTKNETMQRQQMERLRVIIECKSSDKSQRKLYQSICQSVKETGRRDYPRKYREHLTSMACPSQKADETSGSGQMKQMTPSDDMMIPHVYHQVLMFYPSNQVLDQLLDQKLLDLCAACDVIIVTPKTLLQHLIIIQSQAKRLFNGDPSSERLLSELDESLRRTRRLISAINRHYHCVTSPSSGIFPAAATGGKGTLSTATSKSSE